MKLAFFISFLAGASTLIGAIILFIFKKNDKIITASLSFAASVMLFISILDLIPLSYQYLNKCLTKSFSIINIMLFIIIGIILSILIENLVPDNYNDKNNLYKVGITSMIAIILHNIPEGIATFITSSSNIKIGITLALAITFHNIPEGISISLPIYYSTGNKKKAILYTLISGMSEPLGAILTFLFLMPFVTNITLGILFSIISGVMIYISLFSLTKTALKYKNTNTFLLYFFIGLLFVIFTLII